MKAIKVIAALISAVLTAFSLNEAAKYRDKLQKELDSKK